MLKFFLFIAITILISTTAGRVWFFVFFGMMMIFPLVIHLWWLLRHGINGWTGEPKEKCYGEDGSCQITLRREIEARS